MRKIIIIITVIVLGIAGFVVWQKQSKLTLSLNNAKEIWYCPMHPQYTSDHAGKCPICGMDLVKRVGHPSKEHAMAEHLGVAGYTPVTINMRQQQLIGVKTVKAVKKPLTRIIRVAGHVAHDIELYEAQLEYVNAWRQYYAFRARRNVADEYRIDWRQYDTKMTTRYKSSDLRDAQLRLLKAEYELQHRGITDKQLADLRQVKYGQLWVDPKLLYFNQGVSVWVYADLPEGDLGYVDVGQEVKVDVPNFNETFAGVVRSVAGSVDVNTRTVRVRIELLPMKSELTVNMLVDVNIIVELNDYVQIPLDALINTGTRQVVFIDHGNGEFVPRVVTVATYGNGMVAIKEGLKEGELVVAQGNFLLDSESRLRASMDANKGGQDD